MIISGKKSEVLSGVSSDGLYVRSDGQWSISRYTTGLCSQLTTGLLCCLAVVVSIVCLIRTISLEYKIVTLETNCDKYETLIHKLIANYDLLAINAIQDNYDNSRSEGTVGADTVPHLVMNAIIEEDQTRGGTGMRLSSR
ncbi:unnamed protein product [Medioppia subpectinata]|uniref:Uncharacterized protein n=1 Tax=Medioppia subpectinata TaxID=1979941 RepID=A0A7R9KDB1_9ACAR|nr:unnamed protein product [Medioppia subpectinata]CAG2101142.1 unnamed protein product [Medioppia subpectinata]